MTTKFAKSNHCLSPFPCSKNIREVGGMGIGHPPPCRTPVEMAAILRRWHAATPRPFHSALPVSLRLSASSRAFSWARPPAACPLWSLINLTLVTSWSGSWKLRYCPPADVWNFYSAPNEQSRNYFSSRISFPDPHTHRPIPASCSVPLREDENYASCWSVCKQQPNRHQDVGNPYPGRVRKWNSLVRRETSWEEQLETLIFQLKKN